MIDIFYQWFSYRGLSPHKLMPMTGVHKSLKLTANPLALLGGSLAQPFGGRILCNYGKTFDVSNTATCSSNWMIPSESSRTGIFSTLENCFMSLLSRPGIDQTGKSPENKANSEINTN
jgi:hypothetical protein